MILNGEWESANRIHRLIPGLIPEPYAFGRFKAKERVTYFYLSEFVHLQELGMPNPEALAASIAELHQKGESPTGMFGFHVTTCDGKMPHIVEWEESWPVFFGKLLRNIFNIDMESNGPWPEMERAAERVLTKVVPRLLGDLRDDNGNPIRPCLLHGDIWEPNLGVNLETGLPILYDVGSYYAHNEMELGQWRTPFCSHLFNKDAYINAYMAKYAPAHPKDEFDDRNRLYSLKSSLNYSAGHPGDSVRFS